MKIKDIKVSKSFRRHKPSRIKVEAAKKFFVENGILDKPVVLNYKDEIIDGYARLIALVELGENDVNENSLSYEKTEYVFAHHPEDLTRKSYVWRLIRNGYDVLVNDMIPVKCKDKRTNKIYSTYVVVDKIEELDYKPYKGKIRNCVIKGV